MSTAWSLHPQLAKDTIAVTDLPLSQLLLSKDANYPWLILVPRQAEAVEIVDLNPADRARLMTEIGQVSETLRDITGCDKLNVAALGNQVPQLHVHIIARRKSDVAWPRPVWGVAPALDYDPKTLQTFSDTLRRRLGPAS
ncbi:MAG: HIT domain-containing protein [Rhizobiales bacterium]|nr:HIT domain-containing protein [Hyphomicrobiales bacterium]